VPSGFFFFTIFFMIFFLTTFFFCISYAISSISEDSALSRSDLEFYLDTYYDIGWFIFLVVFDKSSVYGLDMPVVTGTVLMIAAAY